MAYSQQLQWLTDVYGTNSGHTTCSFLNLPQSAAELASGEAGYAGSFDATDLPDFPANSALIQHYTFAYTHCEWLMGMRKEYIGALVPVLDVGSFGFFSQLFTPGSISNARTIDEEPSHPSYLEYAVGASYARSFFMNRLSTGTAVSFVESRIEMLTGRTVIGSLDLRFSPFSFISGHLRASSFGMGISYSGATVESMPSQGAFTLRLLPLPKEHPLQRIGTIDLSLGCRKIADEPLAFGLSTHVTFKKYGDIRAGYEYGIATPASLNGLSLGAGIYVDAYTVQGGWRYLSPEFGPVWALSLGYNREELKRKTAEDYYRLAVKHYRKNRLTHCVTNAKKALRLDPNMWKAHALISKVASDALRSSMREIAIVYTGNAQGHFTNPDGENSLGGFARQASIISTLRSQFPLTLTIEAGNMITEKMQPLRSAFAQSYLDYIQYDAVGCGQRELLFGVSKFLEPTTTKQQSVLSNAASLVKNSVRYRIIEREGYRFFIASYIDPVLLPQELQTALLPFDPEPLASASKNADMRILIAHDTWEHCTTLATLHNRWDLIICGNLDQRFPTPMRIGSTLLLSAGSEGHYVGNCIVRFDEKHAITAIDNKLYPVRPDVTADTVIARKLSLFTQTGTSGDSLSGTLQNTEGAFAFVSDRDGRNGIYFKVTEQLAEFPLTRTIADTCDNPVLSFSAGLIACRAANTGCKRLLTMAFDGNNKRYIADSLQVSEMTFTPDGIWLYYSAAPCGDTLTDLYRVRCKGGPSYPLVAWPHTKETAPAFSFDGTAMIFGSDRDGTMQLYLTNQEIHLPLRISDQAANHSSPSFSPDGAYIAYISDFSNFKGRGDLWLFERKSGTHRQITQRSNVKEYCWLSDARTIVYTMGAVHFELASVNIESLRYAKVVASDSAKQWDERAPQTMMLGGKERILYTRSFPESGDAQIYRIDTDGTENIRIVNSDGRDLFPMKR